MGRGVTNLKIRSSLACVTLPHLFVLGQTVYERYYRDSQGHRKRHSSICYLWLPINVP